MWLNIALLLGSFVAMEGLAWLMHKYIMHGVMWRWHASHHRHRKGWWEKNDLFNLCFGVLATAIIVVGSEVKSLHFLFWIGLGITLYGLFYTIFHDIIVHRRVRIKFVPRNKYLQRIIRAHYVHHAVHTREGSEAFGFLYAPRKYAASPKKS